MSFTSSRAAGDARRPGLLADEQDEFRVTAASASDHAAIHHFLVDVFQQPSAAEFQAQLEEPSYEPTDRLLIKRPGQIIAHVRTVHRQMRFGAVVLPYGYLADLAVLAPYRGRGYGSALLAEAERRIERSGAVFGLVRAVRPEFYERRAWVRCGCDRCSIGAPRDILAHLSESESPRRWRLEREPPPLHIRFWRRYELAALVRLYDENTRGAYGPSVRSEAFWRWLVGRRACDRIYVAIEGSPHVELGDSLSSIVGYAFMKDGRIVELMTASARSDAAFRLLARACGDAIENDLHEIRLDAPPDHPLHPKIAAVAGARCCARAEDGNPFLVKVFDLARLVERLGRILRARAAAAQLPMPCELGLVLDGERFVLEITAGASRLVPGKLRRSHLRSTRADFVRLLLGDVDVQEAADCGRIAPSTQLALHTARTLLPRLPLWYPPLDDLPADV